MCGCICYQGIWKRHINVNTWIICCGGLTDGGDFGVKHKKPKISCIIMNAFQFIKMSTIIDAFSGIRSKAAIECAQ